MSGEGRPSRSAHIAGLAIAAASVACLAAVWVYGLPLLDGTAFEELAYVLYAAGVAAVLAIAEGVTALLRTPEHKA